MSLWRLEWLRLGRTRRWIGLVGVFALFGFAGPLTARYMSEILKFSGADTEGVVIEFPDPTPADGIAQFVSNALQLGTLVVVIVAAGALAFDAIAEMGVFLRTRVRDPWEILVPRLVVPFAASTGAFLLGVAAAWYETSVLLGSPDVAAMVLGSVLGILFLAFVIALTAAFSQWLDGVLATVAATVGTLIVLPIAGVYEPVGRWMPTRLGSALADLVGTGSSSDYWRPISVAVFAIAGLVWLAVRGARRREP